MTYALAVGMADTMTDRVDQPNIIDFKKSLYLINPRTLSVFPHILADPERPSIKNLSENTQRHSLGDFHMEPQNRQTDRQRDRQRDGVAKR